MEFNEAWSASQQFVKFFRAFEKVQEVLETWVLAEQNIGEKQRQVAALEQQILELTAKAAEEQAEIEGLAERKAMALKEIEVWQQGERAQRTKALKSLDAELDTKRQELQSLRSQNAVQIAEMKKAVAELQEAESQATLRIKRAEEEYAAFKAKIGAA